ncbi:hypothetical protein [Amycolatopsis saalfeldensis]|uniref:hypothetical protein n=1 Tax=Amycolatopsis saalfeldensis TaxID=394193 RepID=UPI00116085DD|nr:hypothetical protein [Amycolatopsis saalfeldensis]
MNHSATQETLARILAIDWANDDAKFEHEVSRARLMVEYLRRAAIWADALDAGDEWPFLDVAAHLDPNLRADPKTIKQLDEISVYIASPQVRIVVESSLHLATLRDASTAGIPDLPDLYEPLLILFERGGGFGISNNFIDFGIRMVPLKTWQERRNTQPIASLAPEALDALDKT